MALEKLENLDKERKDAIINAALMEFAAKGYEEASTIIIAKNAGISKGLMFHYVNSKKDLFLYLYDYSLRIILNDFFASVNMDEKDMLKRCRQIAFLKMELLHKHPQLFDFVQTAIYTDFDEVKAELDKKGKDYRMASFEKLFYQVDESKFKDGLDIAKAKDLIIWSLNGIADKMQQRVKGLTWDEIDYDALTAECDSYFDILKELFYRNEED
ncbi:TetR/AcrR family transcriptional regulator [Sedimentibacter sp.]|uniref:TetR/AcrR family transcriptional regulator n=1 Tax=Sedimentibacter sp. TaxID=1960295 RepID=UPI000EC1E52A|nr:TetR/AcrR family transcriptional regulator [Sedimentibacter sp.]HCX61570.1 TetR family transcriptional regulator [Clostridiales bacterium]